MVALNPYICADADVRSQFRQKHTSASAGGYPASEWAERGSRLFQETTSYSLNTRSFHPQPQPFQTLDLTISLDLVDFQSSIADHLVRLHLVRKDNRTFDLSSIDH
ncbi:hypothetical protein PGT21_011313 [Puccinia graminis f. sp. tritici]|uniref:Uncharacterized protein n=1 Tax=Puccinia graminis f. sp. tritici TaxID=56615 RepID=A0A5B0LMR6_PUCGR|nr:hypothetical protein PGT21_011313 [Puccinia graminis f. sp. tritici]